MLEDGRSFAAMGFDSLMQQALVSDLNEKLGRLRPGERLLSPTAVMDYSTVTALSAYIFAQLGGQEPGRPSGEVDAVGYMREQLSAGGRRLVTLREGDGPTLFLVHTIMGSTNFYLSLVDQMAGYRIIGIDDPNFGSQQKHFKTLEDMAACYAEWIRDSDASEPYQVAGLSFGGAVAFEVAHQLSAMGHSAAAVMLDTACPCPGHLRLPPAEESDLAMGRLEESLDSFYQDELHNNERILNSYDPGQHCRSGSVKTKPPRIVLLKARGQDTTSASLSGLDDTFNGWAMHELEVLSIPGSHFSLCDRGLAWSTAAGLRYMLETPPAVGLTRADMSYEEHALLYAAAHGDTFMCQQLLQKALNWRVADSQGRTVLHHAAANDDLALVKLMVSLGSDAQAVDNAGWTPLKCAKEEASLQAFSLLANHLRGAVLKPPDMFDFMNMNKKQLRIFASSHGLGEVRGRDWLHTLSSLNASSGAAGLNRLLAPAAEASRGGAQPRSAMLEPLALMQEAP